MTKASLGALKKVASGHGTAMTAAELIEVLQRIPQDARLGVYFSEKGLPGRREALHLLESPKNATRLRNAIAEFRDAKAIEAIKELPPVVSPVLPTLRLTPMCRPSFLMRSGHSARSQTRVGRFCAFSISAKEVTSGARGRPS
jgi:hypothetical protein